MAENCYSNYASVRRKEDLFAESTYLLTNGAANGNGRTGSSNNGKSTEQLLRSFQRSLVTLMKTLKRDSVKKHEDIRVWLQRQREKGLIETLIEVILSSWDAKTHIAALFILSFATELQPEIANSLDETAVFVRDSILENEQNGIEDVPTVEHLRSFAALRLLESIFAGRGALLEAKRAAATKNFSDCLCVPFFLLSLGKRMSASKRSECTEMLFRAYRGCFRDRVAELSLTHTHRRLFGEVCVQVANDPESVYQSTAVQVLTDVLSDVSRGKGFLYNGDLNILAGVLLRDAGKCNPRAVQCLRSYRRCYADNDYMKEQIDEILEEFRDL